MNRITNKKQVSENVCFFEMEVLQTARCCKAGNFVIVRLDEKGERMPLAIVDSDASKGTITVAVERTGKTAEKICSLKEGDEIADVLGPLGNPIPIDNVGTVVCAGSGIGIASLFPLVKALKAKGNRVLTVVAGSNKEKIMLNEEFHKFSDEVTVMTEDGSDGERGSMIDGVEAFIRKESIGKLHVMASPVLMKECCEVAKKHEVPVSVSLHTTMLDGIGMCGACRLTIDGKLKFSCIDGPNFDGALVDWDEIINRSEFLAGSEEKNVSQEPSPKATQCQAQKPLFEMKMAPEPTDEPLENLMDREAQWRKDLRASMKPKERMALERTPMPVLDPEYRVMTRMEEVNMGYTKDMAMQEARRCLDCANPTCVKGCPANNHIPDFIKNVERGEFLAAARILKTTTLLPAVCGRVCPQEKQCEGSCIHLKMKRPAVAIGNIERFVADYERECGYVAKPEMEAANGIKVAVVGSGPAGLTFASDMAKHGYDVHVFESLHEIGGVLKYGIPEFRLPRRVVDVEIESLKEMGVHFHTNCAIGKTVTVEDLKKDGFKGFFVGTGAGVPNFMNIPGENALNILSANEFLMRVNLMNADIADTDTSVKLAKHVIVVGGGNTAMDSCCTARRLGAEVTLVYRRSEEEMPACQDERNHAKEEGVNFLTLHNPLEYTVDENGAVKAAVLQEMQLGEPDASGRRRPVPIPGKTKTIETDMVVVAVGVSANPPVGIKGLVTSKWNTIEVNEDMQTSCNDMFAGGDIVRGGATVILAMGDGKRAAEKMAQQLQPHHA